MYRYLERRLAQRVLECLQKRYPGVALPAVVVEQPPKVELGDFAIPMFLMSIAAITLVMLGVGGWLALRRRAEVCESDQPRSKEPDGAETLGTIAFACEGCRRAIRARPEFARKRVKCPACGETMVVPGQVKETGRS